MTEPDFDKAEKSSDWLRLAPPGHTSGNAWRPQLVRREPSLKAAKESKDCSVPVSAEQVTIIAGSARDIHSQVRLPSTWPAFGLVPKEMP
jgi:hypothetical protein